MGSGFRITAQGLDQRDIVEQLVQAVLGQGDFCIAPGLLGGEPGLQAFRAGLVADAVNAFRFLRGGKCPFAHGFLFRVVAAAGQVVLHIPQGA